VRLIVPAHWQLHI